MWGRRHGEEMSENPGRERKEVTDMGCWSSLARGVRSSMVPPQ